MYELEFETDIISEFLKIPHFEQFKNKHVRIVIQTDFEQPKPKKHKTLAGALHKYAKPELIASEKEVAWSAVAKGKR